MITATDGPPTAFLHDASGAVRFWVLSNEGRYVGASIAKEVLHHRFRADPTGKDAVATYTAHRDQIDEAVRRRLASGSLEPVMLREFDLAAPPPP